LTYTDFFFFISFSLQLVLLVLHQIDAERWITIATAPVTFIVLLMGYFAVKREKVFLAWSFLISCIVGAGYFIFKVGRLAPLLALHTADSFEICLQC
jgi:CHASE2 domain-containing sensor protein